MFIHIKQHGKKYEVPITENGLQSVQGEILEFDVKDTTVKDVLEKLNQRLKDSQFHLYNEHNRKLLNSELVEHARVYTIKRKPLDR